MARAREEGFSKDTVIKAAGVTYRQLDYWARKGIVVPSVREAHGSGSRRLYSFTDIVQLRMIKKLLDAGVTLPKIRRALDYVRTELGMRLQDVILASDGKTVFACASPNEVIDVLSGGQAVFAITVGKVYEELEGSIAELRTRTEGEEEPTPGTSQARGG